MVLDLGLGGGIDVLLSARRVGPSGKAYGLDMTEQMLGLARRNATQAGGMLLAYQGEIGADLWAVGQQWCELVAGGWEQTVAASLAAVKAEAERRAAISTARPRSRPTNRPRQPAGSAPPAALPRIAIARARSTPAPGG